MKIISGIQQIGIGVEDVTKAFAWYRRNFGMDIRVFEEAATAALMLPYTGGEPRSRHAVLAINLQGGGGFEIWQYTSRQPQKPTFQLQLGDLGIFITKMKCRNADKALVYLKNKGVDILSEVMTDSSGQNFFYVKDPFGNFFQYVETDEWFTNTGIPVGGVLGCIIGVSQIDLSYPFYHHILGHDKIVYDETRTFADFQIFRGGHLPFRRMLLTHSQPHRGAFSPVLGSSQIELVQVMGRTPEKIYKNRFWGDPGFIHLCWDVKNMDFIKEECDAIGQPFTVDTGNSFDMGEAAGRFSYAEDVDGTLIEFVETHKVPVAKKWGWYLSLKKRNPARPLPRLILKAMAFNRVKD